MIGGTPMDDATPDLKLTDGEEDAPQGCLALWSALGLAAYAGVILMMMLIGLLGLASSSVMMLLADADSGAELMSGVEASGWRLVELRRVGVLAEGDVPSLYHDHSPKGDGSAGCLVSGDQLVRWASWAEAERAPILASAVVEVAGDPKALTVTLRSGGASISCPFSEGQGGDRLARMLSAEIRRLPEAP